MRGMSRAGHLLRRTAATAVFLTACGHYSAGEAPAPQLAPTPGASTTDASSPIPEPVASTSLTGCDPLTVATGTVVAERVRGETACVPPLGAVAYRCDPSVDPMVVLGLSGQTKRFAGGRFAVPTLAVPEGTVDVGVTSAGRLWVVDGGGHDALYVEGSEGVRRWLPLPSRNAVADPPQAVVIGDSLMDGSQEELVAALPDWSLAVDAEVGRGSSAPRPSPRRSRSRCPTSSLSRSARTTPTRRPSRGTSSGSRRDDSPQLLFWLTGHGPDSTIDLVNRAILAGMAGQPQGAVLDWDTLVPADALDPDGVHLLGDRKHVMADLIADRLTAWRTASQAKAPPVARARCGGGATRRRRRVRGCRASGR